MLAAYAASTGGDDPLANLAVGEQPEPQLEPGWALVEVRAASLNHHDLWTLRGVSSAPIVPPQILGCDAAGLVAAYGDDQPAGASRVGTRVVVHAPVPCGHCPACTSEEGQICRTARMLSEPPLAGTFAELVAVPAANLIPLPDAVDFVTAACLPTAYLTAYHGLFARAGLRPGMTVLVQGVAGGLASAAILLGALHGLTVYATSRDEAKRNLAVQLGAAAAYPPERETARALIGATGGMGVDAVIDTVGEPTWELSLRAVRPRGTVVVSGATAGHNPPAELRRIFFRSITVAGSTMGTRADLRRLVELCARGRLHPLIGSRHPLNEAAMALAEMARGDVHGKIVLEMPARNSAP
jgi:NADPH:quinone reductase-like Zn-dependent oxidoreductase